MAMVTGYPAGDADRIVAAWNEQLWEKLNAAPDIDGASIQEDFGFAIDALKDSEKSLDDLLRIVTGYPMEYRVLAILGEIGNVIKDVEKIRDMFRKEVFA